VSGQGRMGRIFSKMRDKCPELIDAYGRCVQKHISDVRKGKCEEDFLALRECFNATRQETQ